MGYRIEHGDCLDVLWREPPCSVDSVVTDPPAGISLMQSAWDNDKGGRNRWIAWLAERIYAAKRVMKPGAHALIWALPRTSHWTGMAIEDGGLEVRDVMHLAFGSGMPKSRNLGNGRGTGLKPSHEHWFLCRKPLDGTTSTNVERYGTGGLNIDACRVAHASPADFAAHDAGVKAIKARGGSMAQSWKNSSDLSGANDVSAEGRWPPNFAMIHSESCQRVGTKAIKANPTWDTPNRDTEASSFTGGEVSPVRHAAPDGTEDVPVFDCAEDCPVREMDTQSGECVVSGTARKGLPHHGSSTGYQGGFGDASRMLQSDTGTASRYFPQFEWSDLDDVLPFVYFAKASRAERERGLEHFRGRAAQTDTPNPQGIKEGARNTHPTPKSIAAMEYFCRLVTPPGGKVLDLFMGTASIGVGALLGGFEYLGIEQNDTDEEPFVSIARARLEHVIGREYIPRASLRSAEPPRQGSLF